MIRTLVCRVCGNDFETDELGRPPAYCSKPCKAKARDVVDRHRRRVTAEANRERVEAESRRRAREWREKYADALNVA